MKPRINLVAVIVAGIVNFMLGAAWYSLFSNTWLYGIGRTREELMAMGISMPMAYTVAFICDIALAYAIAVMVQRSGAQSLMRGVQVGGFAFLGVFATGTLMQYAFEGKHVQAFAVNGGYMLLIMAVSGAIVGSWKAKVKQEKPVAAAAKTASV